MIAEATPRGIGTLDERFWGLWFEDLRKFMNEKQVRALCYINIDWESQRLFQGKGWQDARIQSNSLVQSAWAAEMQHEQYLHAGPTLYASLGYQPQGAIRRHLGRFFRSLKPYKWR